MRRALLLFATALATVALGSWLAPVGAARAVATSQVVGSYRLRLKGDGWMRGTELPYGAQRVAGTATLVLSRNVPDDGKMHVEIALDPVFAGTLLDLATPEPAFVGDAAMVGNSLALIDSGGPTYVNTLTMTFLHDGGKIVGHWVSAYPATDSVLGAASGVGVDFTGRRIRGHGSRR